MALLIRNLFIGFILLMMAATALVFWNLETRPETINYTDFLAILNKGEVKEVRLRGGEVCFTDISGRELATFSPDIGVLLPKLMDRQVVVSARPDRSSLVWNSVSLAIPILLILGAWIFMARRQQGGKEESDFAKDKVIKYSASEKQVTFKDVAGIPEAKEELVEIIEFLKNPERFSRIGATIPKGVLLQGPPGTGKTLLARAIAGEAGVPFFSFSGSDFVEMFVGVGASRVRDLFKEAKKNAPCIVFIDEIDAVGAHRGAAGAMGGQDERGQTLNALLVEIDGFSSADTIVVLAATNRPDILDPALLRSGRFDRQINILPPDVKGRLKILEVYAQRVKVMKDIDLFSVARSTPGFTGADLANLMNEAALLAARQGKEVIELPDFEAAKDRILMGVERKGLVITEKDRRTMAYHEAGHAIVAQFLPESDPLHKITIIPRGRAMGHTQQLPLKDRHAYSKVYLRNRITIFLGGRAAEEIVLTQQTTGAQDDLFRATEIAMKMICKWGMSETMGPLAYAKDDSGFLGEQTTLMAHSEETARRIDKEIKILVESCYREAVAIITRERDFLVNLAEILLQTETLDSEELRIIFDCTQKKQSSSEQQSSKDGEAGDVHECSTCPAAAHCTHMQEAVTS